MTQIKESTIAIHMAPFAKARPRVTENSTYMPAKYTKAREELQWLYKEQGGELDVDGLIELSIIFVFVMPKKWSKKKKMATDGKWCLKTPDLDNCIGAVMDAILSNDSHVASIKDCRKIWGFENMIIITLKSEPPWQYIPF